MRGAARRLVCLVVLLATPACGARPMEPQVTHPEAPSHYTSVALAAGWQPDPITVEGTAGGGVGAGSQSRGCTGWITSNPSHLVQLQTPLPFLRIAVSSSSDTTLVIRTPDGRFLCADDSGLDVNPHIDQSDAAPGDYAVWVGSYARGGSAAYTMSITELP